MCSKDLPVLPFLCDLGSIAVSGPRLGSSSSNISNGEARGASLVMLVNLGKNLIIIKLLLCTCPWQLLTTTAFHTAWYDIMVGLCYTSLWTSRLSPLQVKNYKNNQSLLEILDAIAKSLQSEQTNWR